MKPEIRALCETLGLRLFDASDLSREGSWIFESQGKQCLIEVSYDAQPKDVAELLFKAGSKQTRQGLCDRFNGFVNALNEK